MLVESLVTIVNSTFMVELLSGHFHCISWISSLGGDSFSMGPPPPKKKEREYVTSKILKDY